MKAGSRALSSQLQALRLKGAGTFILVVLFLAGCAKPPSPSLPVQRTVEIQQVFRADTTTAMFTGRLQSPDRSRVSFEIGGLVKTIEVDLGDVIREGQLLATLDDTDLRLAVRNQQANLANATAEFRDAQRDFQRRSALAGTGATSQSAIDQAEARFDRARAQVRALEAQLAQAEQRLSKSRLMAPFSGEVVARQADPAEVVASGQPILQLIGEESPLEVTTNLPASIRNRLQEGDTAEVATPFQTAVANAKVVELGAQANSAGLFPVTLRLEKRQSSMRPGESVEVRWTLADGTAPVLIPLTAFQALGDDRAKAFVVDPTTNQPKVVSRDIRLGKLRHQHAEVIAGLEPEEWVVSKGVGLLEDGETVHTVGAGLARYNR